MVCHNTLAIFSNMGLGGGVNIEGGESASQDFIHPVEFSRAYIMRLWKSECMNLRDALHPKP